MSKLQSSGGTPLELAGEDACATPTLIKYARLRAETTMALVVDRNALGDAAGGRTPMLCGGRFQTKG
jgi:hypothetical protein